MNSSEKRKHDKVRQKPTADKANGIFFFYIASMLVKAV